eukprot:scaffold12017_cov120-Isochrysis_galbana.AAC.16
MFGAKKISHRGKEIGCRCGRERAAMWCECRHKEGEGSEQPGGEGAHRYRKAAPAVVCTSWEDQAVGGDDRQVVQDKLGALVAPQVGEQLVHLRGGTGRTGVPSQPCAGGRGRGAGPASLHLRAEQGRESATPDSLGVAPRPRRPIRGRLGVHASACHGRPMPGSAALGAYRLPDVHDERERGPIARRTPSRCGSPAKLSGSGVPRSSHVTFTSTSTRLLKGSAAYQAWRLSARSTHQWHAPCAAAAATTIGPAGGRVIGS